MNDITDTIEHDPAASQSTALVVIPAAQLPTIMAADGAADILAKLVAELSGCTRDATTEKNRREMASKSRKAAVAKMDLIRLANTLKEGAQRTIRGVNEEVRIVIERMDALRDSIRAPLDEFEAREAARVAAHEAGIATIEGWGTIPSEWKSDQIAARMAEIGADELLTRDWQEFASRAQQAATHAFSALKVAKADAMQREAEAAEQARAAAERAEQRRQAEETARQEREAGIAAQAAENARVEAERKAAEEAAEVERRAQAERVAAARREQEARDAAAQAERDRAEAEERARQAEARREADRVAAHQSAIRTIEAQDQFSRTPTAADIQARCDGLRQPFRWDFQEFTEEAEAARAVVMERLTSLLTDAEKREAEAAEAERVAREQQAERDRHAAEAEAKRREEAATTAERQRLEREAATAKAEAQKREANIAHRRKINREASEAIEIALSGIEGFGAAKEQAQTVVKAIAKGEIPNVRINY